LVNNKFKRKREIDKELNIYFSNRSFGCVLFEMIKLERLFKSETPWQVASEIDKFEFSPIKEHEIAADLMLALESSLSKCRENRKRPREIIEILGGSKVRAKTGDLRSSVTNSSIRRKSSQKNSIFGPLLRSISNNEERKSKKLKKEIKVEIGEGDILNDRYKVLERDNNSAAASFGLAYKVKDLKTLNT
jgi:hypothetical protein